MKNFFYFLLFVFALIGAFIAYKIYFPDNTRLIKVGRHWVPVEQNYTNK
jgi:hypothetical protein